MTTKHTHATPDADTGDAELAAAEQWLDQLDPTTVKARDARYLRAIIAAAEGLAAAEEQLRQAVAEARKAGDSWTVIGAALGTTRQAAQQRFRSADKGPATR
jgi:dihydroxyacetone kinase